MGEGTSGRTAERAGDVGVGWAWTLRGKSAARGAQRDTKRDSHSRGQVLFPGWNRVGNESTLRARGLQVQIVPVFAPSG